MCSWDRSYHNPAYPKRIIEPEDMDARERVFYNDLLDVLEDKLIIDDLLVEQRDGDYRTVVYGSWDNDFLRYHFGADGFWISVRMSRKLMKEYQDSALFAAQENKRQFHWRSSVRSDEIAQIGDIISESALFFLDSLSRGQKSGNDDECTIEKPEKNNVGLAKKLPKTVGEDLKSAWSISEGDIQAFKQQLEQRGYTLFATREITLASTNAYKAASKLKGGEVLECRCEETNPYDNKAVAVFINGGLQVGYLPKNGIKLKAFEAMKNGCEIAAIVSHRGMRAGSKRDRTHILLISTI